MNPQPVRFIVREPVASMSVYREDSYQFRKDGGWLWLQKMAFRFLRWRGAYAVDVRPIFKTVTIDTKKFGEALFRQNYELTRRFGEAGERLLIGPEEYGELMNEAPMDISHPVTFSTEYQFWGHDWYYGVEKIEADYSRPPTVCGLKVTIVPWMKGMLVMPKE